MLHWLLYEEDYFAVFILVTVVLGGGAAWLAGRAIALTWRPWWHVLLYMLILGGACVALVEVAEFIIWRHDRRQARLHPDPYAGLADDELSPLDLDDTGSRDSHLN